MSDTPTIRAMEKSDTGPVLEMVGQLAGVGNSADPRFELDDDWHHEMRQAILGRWFGVFQPFPCCWVAEKDGKIVGLVQGDVMGTLPIVRRPPSVRIGNMWVAPGHRRQGIGRKLVKTYVNQARKRGFPWVEVGTLAKDDRAVAFWRAMGFDDWRVIMLNEAENDHS